LSVTAQLADLLGGAQPQHVLAIWALSCARVAPLCLLAPWLAFGRGALGLGLLLSVLAAGAFLPIALAGTAITPDAASLDLLYACGLELLRGSLLAVGAALPFSVLSASGVLSDALRVGLPAAYAQAGASSLLGELLGRAGLTLCLFASLHLGFVRLFAETLQSAPLGAAIGGSALRAVLLELGMLVVRAFELSVQLTVPLLLAMFVLALVVGLLMRVAVLPLAPVAAPVLLPWLGLAVICLGSAQFLERTPDLVRLFARESTRLLHALH
jgi:flagellar biosynthesis protein FliR